MVGSLLDAHPDIVIAHEYDILGSFREFNSREAVFDALMQTSEEQAAQGRISNKYSFKIDNAFQGNSSKPRIIGDKKGSRSSIRINENPALLDEFQQKVQLPLKLIHVIRNPFDILTTKGGYKNGEPCEVTESQIRIAINQLELEANVNDRLIRSGKYDIYSFKHESLIESPEKVLSALVTWLGCECSDTYLESCTKILFPSAQLSRLKYPWTDSLKSEVKKRIQCYSSFSQYSY